MCVCVFFFSQTKGKTTFCHLESRVVPVLRPICKNIGLLNWLPPLPLPFPPSATPRPALRTPGECATKKSAPAQSTYCRVDRSIDQRVEGGSIQKASVLTSTKVQYGGALKWDWFNGRVYRPGLARTLLGGRGLQSSYTSCRSCSICRSCRS